MAKKQYPFSSDKEDMLKVHRGLIESTVKYFSYSGAPEEDLRQEAKISFVQAVDRFDKKKGAKFSTFAVERMRGSIRNYLVKFWWQPLKIPAEIMRIAQKILTMMEQLEREYGRIPTLAELSDRWSIPISQIESAFDALMYLHVASLSEEIGEGTYLEDAIADPCDATKLVDLRLDVNTALGQIADADRDILQQGLDGNTQRGIAARRGCSHQNIQWQAKQVQKRLAGHLPAYGKTTF